MTAPHPPTQGHAPACSGVNRNGAPCRSAIVAKNGWCLQHDPDRAGERAAAYRAGGYGRSNVRRSLKALPVGLMTVLDLLHQALREVHDGGLEPGRASAMARLASAIVQVHTAGEFGERLAAIERQIGIGGRG